MAIPLKTPPPGIAIKLERDLKAYYEIDNISKADLNIAKYYSLIGDLDSAKRFSERAKQGLKYSSPDWLAADDIQNIN